MCEGQTGTLRREGEVVAFRGTPQFRIIAGGGEGSPEHIPRLGVEYAGNQWQNNRHPPSCRRGNLIKETDNKLSESKRTYGKTRVRSGDFLVNSLKLSPDET